MEVKLCITGYEIDKKDIVDSAEITLKCRIKNGDGRKFSPAEELNVINKALDKLSEEGVEISEDNVSIEVHRYS